MIRNVLVGYDDTRYAEIAVEQAVTVAEATGGRIHMALIADQPAPGLDPGLGLGPAPDEAPRMVEYESPEDRLAADETDLASLGQLESAGALCEKAGVPCTVTRLFGSPVDRLMRRASLADLMVIGRGTGAAYRSDGGKLGSMARQLLLRTTTPTMLCDTDYVPYRSALLLYEPTDAGGRAVAQAGQLCSYLNMDMRVVVPHPDRRSGERLLRDVKAAVRSYHVDSDFHVFPGPAADAVQAETTGSKVGLVVMPQPPRPLWSWQTPSALRSAIGLPGTLVLVVP